MQKDKKLKVIISGGGSGGHVFPALAIADAIKKEHPNTEFLFVGAKGKIEMDKVPAAGYKIKGLNIAGFQRSLSFSNLTFPFKLAGSLMKSYYILKKFKPHVAVGVGGYASGPIVNIASWMKVPTLIQEQNSYPGITNRLLAGKASVICTAYDDMERFFPSNKIKFTGNPVRTSIFDSCSIREDSYSHFSLEKGRKTILIVGGSLGARTLNESVKASLRRIVMMEDVQVLWQTGKYYYQDCLDAARYHNNVKVFKFIDRMDRAYDVADVILARAGALTISELCIVGKPVILIPSPNVTENHQMKNAMSLADKDAVIMIPDNEAVETLFDNALKLLRDPDRCKTLSDNIRKLAINNAGERIAKEVLSLVKE